MRDAPDADVLIIGAGPAGASAAILLRLAGWRVILVEKNAFPRQKVCGECLSAASLAVLDRLGVGSIVQDRAGPELRQVGWLSGASTVVADLPRCTQGPYAYGRALGRDQLDAILVKRAGELGVGVLQPGRVRAVRGEWGNFECDIQASAGHPVQSGHGSQTMLRRARIVIDAHGSWEPGPQEESMMVPRAPHRGSDLFGFKASFINATLPHGLLPVLSFRGGYGGLVMAEDRRLTLAGCLRRDTLTKLRADRPGTSAGAAFETYLRTSCSGLRDILHSARQVEPWLTIGPLRPGNRLSTTQRVFAIGNAAGETHPLIGEGMSMALQAAFLLVNLLVEHAAAAIDATRALEIQRRYRAAWCNAFEQRLRLSALFAHLAMRPVLSRSVTRVLRKFPQLLTAAAQLSGKARPPLGQSLLFQAMP